MKMLLIAFSCRLMAKRCMESASPDQRSQAEAFGRRHLTGLVTLVFTDLVDSTGLKQRLGDRQSFEFFQKHDQLLRDCRARFPHSQEIETAGDSFLLLFAVPSDAVAFALTVQAKLRTLFAGSGVAVQDRLGINLGEVLYNTGRKLGNERSKEILGDIMLLPIQLEEVTMARVIAAAQIKSQYPISYADAFAIAVSLVEDGILVTADHHEIEPLEAQDLIAVEWIR